MYMSFFEQLTNNCIIYIEASAVLLHRRPFGEAETNGDNLQYFPEIYEHSSEENYRRPLTLTN